MRLLDVHPKKNFSYIFIQFPGMKMNVPMLSKDERKAVKGEVALCVQLNSKEKVNHLYLVHSQSINPFDFTENGANAFFRVIKKKESSTDSPAENKELVSFITEEASIVQKKTETGYQFILVLNNREIGIIASIEEEVLLAEKVTCPPKEEAKEYVAVKSIRQRNMPEFLRRGTKTITSGGKAFQANEVFEPIRILYEGVKRKVKVFSPAALDFLGPGDHNHSIFNRKGW